MFMLMAFAPFSNTNKPMMQPLLHTTATGIAIVENEVVITIKILQILFSNIVQKHFIFSNKLFNKTN